ncbi:MAG: AAA family ATPase [Hormoscilla sp. SP5CHS1]|nr:AAA family ATPase [Hormoscilla sp. SP12CHS1]MBC6452267.1 AAA family ATPase [Hormoscilla sp. SP5CHS1]
MLKKIILENWKSFQYAELPIDPLTVLIGTNASGKSNVLDALDFLKRMAWDVEIHKALTGDRYFREIRGGLEWASFNDNKEERQPFTLKALIQGEDETTDYLYSITIEIYYRAKLWAESLFRLKQTSGNAIEKVCLFQTDAPSESSIYILLEEKHQLPFGTDRLYSKLNWLMLVSGLDEEVVGGIKVVLQTLRNIVILNPIPVNMRDYSAVDDRIEDDASNIAGLLAALPEKQKEQVESTLSAYARKLPVGDFQKVWAEKVGKFGSHAMLYCEELWKPDEPKLIDARVMSDGTLRFLGIVTALLTLPEGSQLVIEDVDSGLHPSRTDLLIEMLREIGEQRKIDILVTTHNAAMLDALGPEMVPFVAVAHRDPETGASRLTLLEEIENLPKLMASGTLGKLTAKGAIERSISG